MGALGWEPSDSQPSFAMITIYGLVDKREPKHVRYVGATADLPHRFKNLRTGDRTVSKRPVKIWTQSLYPGRHLDYVVLATPMEEFARIEEKFWVTFLREQGHDLLNHNPTGWPGHTPGVPFSSSHKDNLRAAQRARWN